MAKQVTTTTTKSTKGAAAAALPTTTPAAAPVGAQAAAPVAPAPAVLASARTSAQQAQAWHAASGTTMPPAALPLALGTVQPKQGNGPRAQHQQGLVWVLAQHPNGTCTVAQAQAHAKAHAAALVAKFGPHAAQCAAPGNLRCTLGAGVVVVAKA